jgi:hypothetical protein
MLSKLSEYRDALFQGADINSQHKMNGWTPLHWAAKRNHLDCVELLLSRGADKLITTPKGELPAHLTTNKNVLKVLGYTCDSNKARRDKVGRCDQKLTRGVTHRVVYTPSLQVLPTRQRRSCPTI